MIVDGIITFMAGACYEAACVLWVHYSERNAPLKTALAGMFCALCQVLGIGESIRDPLIATCFITGYGVGTYFTVALKRGIVRKVE